VTLTSGTRADGSQTPIPFAALSGLSPGSPTDDSPYTIYAVDDRYADENRILTIDTSADPVPRVVDELFLNDFDRVLVDALNSKNYGDAIERLVTVNNTLSIDGEGLVRSSITDTFWVVHEGEDLAVISPNMLVQVNATTGSVLQVVFLPDDFVAMQTNNGLEGITELVAVSNKEDDPVGDSGNATTGAGVHSVLIVGVQREWGDEAYPRIGAYDTRTGQWRFAYYPVDPVESPDGGWVGVADLSYNASDVAGSSSSQYGSLLVVERDNKGGDEARVKRIYKTKLDPLMMSDGSTASAGAGTTGNSSTSTVIPVLEKELVLDLIPILEAAYNGPIVEKTEGMALDGNGNLWIVNDDDGDGFEGGGDPTLLLKVIEGGGGSGS